MNRIALALTLTLCACGARNDDEMAIKPWHMWGNSIVLEVPHSLVTLIKPSQQLVKVAYGRPDTWRWLFAITLSEVDDPTSSGIVDVRFNLTAGLGRSSTTFQNFERLAIQWTAPVSAPIGAQRFSTSVWAEDRVPNLTNPAPNIVESIPAEDIQLQVDATFTGSTAPVNRAVVQVAAYFSPLNHLRPEWLQGTFNGETGGH